MVVMLVLLLMMVVMSAVWGQFCMLVVCSGCWHNVGSDSRTTILNISMNTTCLSLVT